jgi:two-component system, cell cycle sensor histidine kinase and response regulator CckA
MQASARPANEPARLAALREYAILDTPAEPRLDELAQLAAHVSDSPMAAISLVDANREWLKARVNLPFAEIPRSSSLCAHALGSYSALIVGDAATDRRFAACPIVTGEPRIRFFACAPLIAPEGFAIGGLCVMDRVARELTAPQLEAVLALGRQVMTQLESRRQAHMLGERERRLRAIIDTEPECVKLIASDGALIEMNRAGLDMIEADSFDQIAGRSIYPLIEQPYRESFEQLTASVFAGESGALQFEITGLKGGRRWLDTRAAPLLDAAGQVSALLAITRDVTDQRRAERDLRESEARFAKAFYSSPAALVLARLSDRTIVDVNVAFETMTGLSRADCLDRTPVSLGIISDDTRDAFVAALQESGAVRQQQFSFRHSQGESRIGLGWAHILAALLDITERSHAARALQESEERLRLAIEAAHFGTFDWDLDADRLVWSRRHEEMWGLAPGEFSGTYESFARGVHPEDLPAVEEALTRCRATRRPFEHEFRVVRPDGETRWVMARGEFVFAADGRAVRMRGLVLDTTVRKLEAMAVQESERRLQEAQRNARIGSWRHLADGTLIWSAQMYELFQLPRDRPPTREAALARLHPDDRPGPTNTALASAIADGRDDFDSEFRVIWPNRQVRYLYLLGKVRRDQAGQVIEAVGTVQDVTDRKRAELKILKLNRVYAMLSAINETIVRERTPKAILTAACRIAVESGGFLMAWIGAVGPPSDSVEVAAHAGADAETLAVVRSFLDHASPGSCAFVTASLTSGRHSVCNDIGDDARTVGWRDAAMARGYRSMAAFPIKIGPRVVGTFAIYGGESGLFDADEIQLLDELAADIGFALEVHEREQERVRAEAERRRAEERFREVVENIQEVFWIADPVKTEIIYVSPAYQTIWGRSDEALYRNPRIWIDAMHPDDRHRMASVVRASRTTGGYAETYRIIRPDGSVRWIRDQAFPVHDASGKLARLVGTAVDITEQRLLEDQFRHAQKMESVGRLAGGIAHDFNNILTVINGLADMALDELNDQDPLHGDLLQIRDAGERAAALTRQLLALSRQQILKPEVLDLRIIIGGMEGMLRRLIGEDVTLTLKMDGGLGNVKADPGQIEQVIMNLAVNARDAMPDGGQLTIEATNVEFNAADALRHPTTQPGPCVMVAVTDTGVGIDEATRQRIFEPFYTTKPSGKGTGLGLSMVYGIVKQSGGTIWVYSEPGIGTTFKIYLPRVDEAVRHQRPAPSAAANGTETILLVEDESALRILATRILQGAGYTVLEAANGGAALLALEQYPGDVHLLMTDVVMPGMNGGELAARLATLRPRMKVLFSSGYADEAILRHGVLDDVRRFISKPYTAAQLRQKVREVLDDNSD